MNEPYTPRYFIGGRHAGRSKFAHGWWTTFNMPPWEKGDRLILAITVVDVDAHHGTLPLDKVETVDAEIENEVIVKIPVLD